MFTLQLLIMTVHVGLIQGYISNRHMPVAERTSILRFTDEENLETNYSIVYTVKFAKSLSKFQCTYHIDHKQSILFMMYFYEVNNTLQ